MHSDKQKCSHDLKHDKRALWNLPRTWMAVGIVRCLCPLSSRSCCLLSQGRLPALVRGLTLFVSAGSSGTRLLNSFWITEDGFCIFLLTKLLLRTNIRSTVKITQSWEHVIALLLTEKLLVINNEQWEFVETSAEVSAVCARGSSHCSSVEHWCALWSTEQSTVPVFALFWSTVSLLQRRMETHA